MSHNLGERRSLDDCRNNLSISIMGHALLRLPRHVSPINGLLVQPIDILFKHNDDMSIVKLDTI
jgi:hypothetical protein